MLWVPAVVLLLGVLVTGTLAWVSHDQYRRNEQRLLGLRVRDAGALLTAALPDIQSELASAAELADATNGNVRKFTRFVAPYVGTGPGKQFVSVSLWRLADPERGPVAVTGAEPKLGSAISEASAFFARAAASAKLGVIGLLRPPGLRLGYAFATPGVTGGFVAYGESQLPADRRSAIGGTSAFAGLDYARYLGSDQRFRDLLITSQVRLPLPGPTDSVTVPFGNSALTLVMSSRVSLAGSLPQRLPWIIGIVGTLLAVGASAGARRLTERRRFAEDLASRLEVSSSENRRLYAEQRSIAQTLQHALLPDALPQVPGVQTSAQYRAGARGVEIGGDWYDVIDLGDGGLLLVVGDVSGRGLPAATTMATLRYAIHAYAAQGDPPTRILTKLSDLVSVADNHQLATVLCAVVDIERRTISITSAGHLPPLVISGGVGEYVELKAGLPVGVETGTSYTSTTISVPPGATFLAFTDGLVEHRDDLEQGLSRLRDAATCDDTGLPELVSRLMEELSYDPSPDDSVILGLRWTS
jgi:serine phosphatase RsbU (regulator of sigma subunit)